jgi:hypothetical protein
MYAVIVDKVKELNDAFTRNFPYFMVVSRRYKASYTTIAKKN